MRVYITGSHSSGKSSLSRYISKKYNLQMISETARMILSEQELQIDTLRCDLDIADNYQRQVFERQLLEEQKYNSFVSDRSIIDVFAYSTNYTRILPELLARSEVPAYIEKLKNTDQFIFFVRPSKATLKADGVREVLNWDGIIAIDAIIKTFLEIYGIRYFQINTDNMQERIKIIDGILGLAKISNI